MGIIPLVELFVRRGNTRERAKSPTVLHRPTERGFDQPRDSISNVAQ